jgi:uncharacterized protein
MACLASRFPYGAEITREKLAQVEAVETFLNKHGVSGARARHHGDILRLELPPGGERVVLEGGLRSNLITFAREQGFLYVTLDLQGYRTGSMNEPLVPGNRSDGYDGAGPDTAGSGAVSAVENPSIRKP